MSTDKQIHVLDELQSLLEEQIKLARQGNPASKRIEFLSKQADCLVGKIAQSGILESAEFKNRREHLKKLYDTLHQIRTGKKTIGTYRSNILINGRV
ncbi:MAG: hypothetical protein ACYS19_10540 [Planctomycetota bacterium]|jgi:hypothetical protein